MTVAALEAVKGLNYALSVIDRLLLQTSENPFDNALEQHLNNLYRD